MTERNMKSQIAIQLGKPPPISEAPGTKKRVRPAHGKRHRAHALHEESASEDNSDNDQQTYGRREAITSYHLHGTSIDDGETRSRGHDSRRDRRGGPPSNRNDDADQRTETNPGSRQKGDREGSSEPQEKPVKWGLTINMRKWDAKGRQERESKPRTNRPVSKEGSREEEGPKGIDDEALDALMGTNTRKRRRADSDAADREPRPDDYRSVPIDDFGATLLRRFGWDGKMRGKVKEVTRRANLTGLGAKDARGAEDLGAWNQKTAKDSRPMRLDDYRREENKKRQQIDDRYADSYKREREREQDRERERGRDR